MFLWNKLRKCVCFGVVAKFSRVFLFGLRSEFLEELWIGSLWASGSAVHLGVFYVSSRRSSGLGVFLEVISEVAEWFHFFDGLAS